MEMIDSPFFLGGLSRSEVIFMGELKVLELAEEAEDKSCSVSESTNFSDFFKIGFLFVGAADALPAVEAPEWTLDVGTGCWG